MEPEVIEQFLGRFPFQPFRITFSNAEPVEVYNPALVVVRAGELIVSNRTRDMFHVYWLTQVVRVEPLRAA